MHEWVAQSSNQGGGQSRGGYSPSVGSSSGGSTKIFYSELENSGGIPLHNKSSPKRLQTAIYGKASSSSGSNSSKRLWRCQKTKGVRQGSTVPIKQGCHRSSQGSKHSRFLFPNLPGSQEVGVMATSHRFKQLKLVSASQDFQDGYAGINSDGVTYRGVDNILGPIRRIPPCTRATGTQEVSAFYGQRSSVSVPCDSIRSSIGTSLIHKVRERGKEHFGLKTSQKSCVSGRLPVSLRFVPRSKRTNLSGSGSVSQPRIRSKSKKIGFHTITNLPLRRVWLQPERRNCIPATFKSKKSDDGGISIRKIKKSPGISSHFLSGAGCSHREDDEVGSASHETDTNGTEANLEMAAVNVDPRSRSPRQDTQVVGRRGKLFRTCPFACPNPRDRSVYRRIDSRVGRTLSGQDCTGDLATQLERSPHKLPRASGSLSNLAEISGTCQGEGSVPLHGQYNSNVIHKQAGGNQINLNVTLNLETPQVVPKSENHPCGETYRRGEECGRGCLIPNTSDTSNRVDAQSNGFHRDMSVDGLSGGGSVRNLSEPSTSPIRIPSTRSRSMGHGRNVVGLDKDVRLPISTILNDHQGSTKNSSGQTQSSCSRSMVATPSLASGTGTMVPVPSNTFDTLRESPKTVICRVVSSQSENAEFTCISGSTELEGQIQDRVQAPQRASTRRVYESRLQAFKDWCEKNQTDWKKAQIKTILLFFQYLFNEGRAPGTIAGYRAALGEFLPQLNIAADDSVARLLRSFFRDRPRTAKLLPPWDLGVVLQALQGAPFEPLQLVSLKFLTLKTVFLMALASGSRRSEIHSWIASGLSWSPEGKVQLQASQKFLAKNQKSQDQASAFNPVQIPPLPEGASDTTLCPIRALKTYLSRTEDMRAGKAKLFIAFKKGFAGEIKPQTISSWLKQVITMSYELLDPNRAKNLKIKAHQVRSMASSWAKVGGASMASIMGACHWSSRSTFVDHYLQDVAWTHLSGFSLGPFVAAQSLVQQDVTRPEDLEQQQPDES